MSSHAFISPKAQQSILLVGGCGYIGSYLYQRLHQAGFDVTVVDNLMRGNPLGIAVIEDDYANLTSEFLKSFDAVLWFAGHSSVGQSIVDPHGAIANNCLNLFSFAKRLSADTKLIYASSASLYSAKEGPVQAAREDSLTTIPAQNAYDISKFAFDYLAEHFLPNYFALRMGTLSGHSPNLRAELVFNAMNIAAVRTGELRLRNPESFRTILFLSDLWSLIFKLLTTQQQPGVYNAGSMSFKMAELAQGIAETWGSKIICEEQSETYSFLLDTTRMKIVCGADLALRSLSDMCREFMEQLEESGGSNK